MENNVMDWYIYGAQKNTKNWRANYTSTMGIIMSVST